MRNGLDQVLVGEYDQSSGLAAGVAAYSGRLRPGPLVLAVSDAFLTETAEFADVVLPAALWGEKTGCYTNADRTVHLSEKAVEPPGEARQVHS